MAKFYGKVGFVGVEDVGAGEWVDSQPVERTYRGEITRDTRSSESSGQRNDNLKLDMAISIIADSYIKTHLPEIRYVKMASGILWEISRVEINKPRIILHLGGIYNGAFGQ